MILKLDKKQIPITNFYETLVERAQMTATNSFEVGDGAQFPDLTGVEGMSFASCKVIDGQQEIPLIGTYRKAESVNASCASRFRRSFSPRAGSWSSRRRSCTPEAAGIHQPAPQP